MVAFGEVHIDIHNVDNNDDDCMDVADDGADAYAMDQDMRADGGAGGAGITVCGHQDFLKGVAAQILIAWGMDILGWIEIQ